MERDVLAEAHHVHIYTKQSVLSWGERKKPRLRKRLQDGHGILPMLVFINPGMSCMPILPFPTGERELCAWEETLERLARRNLTIWPSELASYLRYLV